MTQQRLSMRSIREVLRLKYGLGRTHRQIALEDAADVGPVELDLALEFAGLGNFE